MAKKGPMKCIAAFAPAVANGEVLRAYAADQIVDGNDPVVKAYPQFFEPVDAVETVRSFTATAPPGEPQDAPE